MAELRKYGTATTIYFPLVDAGAVDFESTPVSFAAGDTQISKDGGAFANCSNNPVHEGNGIYSLALTSTEMEAAVVVVTVIDSATKTWEDQAIVIDTYGNASAQHAIDLDSTFLTAAEVNAEVDQALADYDPPTAAELTAGLAALNDLSAAQVNAEVDQALADYDPPTAAELTAGLAALNDLSAAEVNAEVDQALADYDGPTAAELTAGLAALNDLSAAQVNAEVDQALADIHLDHLLAAAYDPDSKPGNAAGLWNQLIESDSGVARYSENALEQGPGGASSLALSTVVEGSLTFGEIMKILLAAFAGKSAGGGTSTITFRNQADDTDRITATVDSAGNRTAVSVDGS
jgi:hypothetical protein